MPDFASPLVDLFEFEKNQGVISKEEFQQHRRRIIFEQRIAVPILVVGILAWLVVILWILG